MNPFQGKVSALIWAVGSQRGLVDPTHDVRQRLRDVENVIGTGYNQQGVFADLFYETGSYWVAEAGFELTIFLPLSDGIIGMPL